MLMGVISQVVDMSKSWRLALIVESSYRGIVSSITKERTQGFIAGLSVGAGLVLAALSLLAIIAGGIIALSPIFSLGLAIFLAGLYHEHRLRKLPFSG